MLHEAGDGLGMRDAGYYAINALRLEKGYRAFGPELTPDITPVEAGLLFATKVRTDIPFLGREALEAAVANGPRRRIVSFISDDPDVMAWGGELVLRGGDPAGQVTSAAYATTTGTCVGLASLQRLDGVVDADFLASGTWEIDGSGRRVPARVSLSAPYDPRSERVRR
jgi:4-methylaminobutanoate oxidase (formaldehyde-forming)